MPHVIVIGAGPAGLFAAEYLAQSGMSVTVHDQKPTPGRKFLMAGRGGLNITHSEPLAHFMMRYGTANAFLKPAIDAFTPDDMRMWCAKLGEDTFIGSSGRVFPKSFKASPLLRAWIQRLENLGVAFHYNHRWIDLDSDGAAQFETPNGTMKVHADAVLLALGGASWPRLGSDGHWVKHLESWNITVTPLASANCGFTVAWSDMFRTKYAGMPLKSVTLTFGDSKIRGEMMITDKGIEGGAVYALSSVLRQALAHQAPITLSIDLKPDYTFEKLFDAFKRPIGRDSFSTYLRRATGLSNVAIGLLQEDRQLRTLPPNELARRIKSFPLILNEPFAIDRAISSAGGIALSAIDQNYMLINRPGVFAAGEMLDWEAPTGGYLLQATFATAKMAARGITAYLQG